MGVDGTEQDNIDALRHCGSQAARVRFLFRAAAVFWAAYTPLPSYRFDTSKTVEHKADSFALVKFDGNKYSVPYQYANKTVTVKGYGDRVVLCTFEVYTEFGIEPWFTQILG